MSRFVQEISGELGDYWKRSAEKELAKAQAELDSGAITIDQHGVARNCIGRVLMDDMLEKVMMLRPHGRQRRRPAGSLPAAPKPSRRRGAR